MAGDTRGTGSGVPIPDPGPRGLAFRGAFGLRGARSIRVWRSLFCCVWLVYLIQPIGGLFHRHYGVLYVAGACAIVGVFCAFSLWVFCTWEPGRGRPFAVLLPLFGLAAVACLAFNGAKWNPLWIYVSVACSLVLADRRVAVRGVVAAAACMVLFSWLGHDYASDILLTLIPVLLVGFAMIGYRMQLDLMRQLTAARETVAELAASEERLRLARDMHDLTGQSLSMITLKSELAARLLGRLPDSPDKDRARGEIEQVAAVSRQTLHDIREAVSGYRRPTLAVEIITARTALEAAGITPHEDTALALSSGTFDPDAEAALAWCLREAVTNVIRHSGARDCYITLTRHAGTVSLSIADNGTGSLPDEWPIHPAIGVSMAHSPGATARGTGLHGMSERLTAVGGSLELRRGSPSGFRLIATVPAGDAGTPDASAATLAGSRDSVTVTR